MEDLEDLTCLELCPYRYLQQLAKSMRLPSNVKKVYLIEMLNAKKYCSEKELDAIVDHIREERKQVAKARKPVKRRKKGVQGVEISSTSNQSPPISMTPQPSHYITYPASARRTLLKNHHHNVVHPSITKKVTESDRVLRSYNNRMRPNYSILNMSNSVIGVIKAQNALQQSRDVQERQYEISVAFQSHRPINIDDCVVQRPRVSGYGVYPDQRLQNFESFDEGGRRLVPIVRRSNISPKPAKRVRRISGIYPLKPPEQSYYPHTPTIEFRRQDGLISKLNAVIQKPLQRNSMPEVIVTNKTTQTYTVRPNVVREKKFSVQNVIPKRKIVTVQDVVNYKIDQQTFSNSSTESARDSSTERENVLTENIHGNERQHAAETPNQYVNRKDNPNKNAVNRNYAAENLNKYPERRHYDVENPDKFPKRRHYAAENPVKYPEHRSYAAENPNKYPDHTTYASTNSNKYPEYRSYAMENKNKNTEGRCYTETPNRYAETQNRYAENHATENLNTYRKSVNYGTRNSNNCTENMNRNALVDLLNMERNVDTDYPNMSALTDGNPENQITEVTSTNSCDNFSVYYHKKIRAEQVRTKRTSIPRDEKLPSITDVFSQFSNTQYKKLTQPLYVQVSEESDKLLPRSLNNTMLESIYNYKSKFLTDSNEPLLRVVTTNATQCVFSTPIITTAVAHPSAAVCKENNKLSFERDSQPYNIESETVPRLYDYMRIAEQERRDIVCDEVLSSSGSSFGASSSQLGANVTIPEMVEDALEIISQDGDYMERIGMDERMQCILCTWAGPKIILGYHIRQEHACSVVERAAPAWVSQFPLGALEAARAWRVQLSRAAGALYVLSVKCALHYFMATISVLPTESDENILPSKYGRLTVYNKVTGEPHTWEGEITHITDTMPYQSNPNGLKLDLTGLDLLPKNANLKLVNGVFVVDSTAKVVGGHPELNDIEIAVYVQIFE